MKKTPINPALDLFGEVPVTFEEVELWVDVVARLPRSSPRREYYKQHWDATGKVKAAKLAGTFDSTISGSAGA